MSDLFLVSGAWRHLLPVGRLLPMTPPVTHGSPESRTGLKPTSHPSTQASKPAAPPAPPTPPVHFFQLRSSDPALIVPPPRPSPPRPSPPRPCPHPVPAVQGRRQLQLQVHCDRLTQMASAPGVCHPCSAPGLSLPSPSPWSSRQHRAWSAPRGPRLPPPRPTAGARSASRRSAGQLGHVTETHISLPRSRGYSQI